jgi:methyl-accepting chemotaxis protein
MAQQKKAFRRSIFLIDRKFQLRYCLYVCSWLFGLSLVYPLIVQSLFDYFLKFLAADPYGPSLAAIQETKKQVISLMLLLQVMLMGVTFLLSIFVSHRIAGPLFKLKRYFREAGEGRLVADLRFRKGDHFQDVADTYNVMMKGLIERDARIAALIERGETQKALAALKPATKPPVASGP